MDFFMVRRRICDQAARLKALHVIFRPVPPASGRPGTGHSDADPASDEGPIPQPPGPVPSAHQKVGLTGKARIALTRPRERCSPDRWDG